MLRDKPVCVRFRPPTRHIEAMHFSGNECSMARIQKTQYSQKTSRPRALGFANYARVCLIFVGVYGPEETQLPLQKVHKERETFNKLACKDDR